MNEMQQMALDAFDALILQLAAAAMETGADFDREATFRAKVIALRGRYADGAPAAGPRAPKAAEE